MKSTFVVIGELCFEVIIVEKGSEYLKIKDKQDLNAGIIDYHDLKIYIDGTMPKSLVESTLMHELVHAYLFAYGFNGTMDEEDLCNFIGNNMKKLYELYSMVVHVLLQSNQLKKEP